MEPGANQHSLQRESLTLHSEKRRSLAAASHQHQGIFGNPRFCRAVHRQPHQQLVHLNILIITSTQITRLKQDSMDDIFLPVANLLKYKSCSSHVSPCWLMQSCSFQHCRHRISVSLTPPSPALTVKLSPHLRLPPQGQLLPTALDLASQHYLPVLPAPGD